jgi:23S rRNA (cytidine1920-2'-O)/16S rRNA (cytidine1409-2'-O)-methyltransferase
LKKRIDLLLVERGFFESREKARASVMSGIVFAGGQRVDKPGSQVSEDAEISLHGNTLQYVSRGGLKLEKAIRGFGISVEGFAAADIGASTGGFTDCMLQNGAKKVYAIDVGYGQLAWKLRTDERVVVMERTNIRNVTPEEIGEPLDFATVDVSFISLKLVLPVVKQLLKPGGKAVTLVKPQFEAGREKVGKKGVVRDPEVHLEVLETYLKYLGSFGFTLLGLTFSPIKGPEGNIEYLGYIENPASPPESAPLEKATPESAPLEKAIPESRTNIDLKALIRLSHEELKVHDA